MSQSKEGALEITGRRKALATGAMMGLGLAMGGRQALAETVTYYGTAFPPGQYGTQDPDAKNKAVYTFEYPEGWKVDPPSKVEKGTKNIDGRVVNTKVPKKGNQAFCVVLARAGEDNAGYTLDDPKRAILGITSSDFDLLETLQGGEVTFEEKTKGGIKYFEYVLKSESFGYLVSITVGSGGRLFALVVKSSAAALSADDGKFKSIISSFRLTGL